LACLMASLIPWSSLGHLSFVPRLSLVHGHCCPIDTYETRSNFDARGRLLAWYDVPLPRMSTTISVTTLSCGLPLIIESNPSVRSAAICWMVPAGASTDPDDRQGMAAMIAELLMRGSNTRTSREQADAFDALGVSRSADVGGSFIRVTASFLADRLTPTLELLADMVLNPRFDADGIEPSRELCLQTVAGLKDDLSDYASKILVERAMPLPLNRSTIGTEQGLKAISQRDIVSHWAARCTPKGSILAISGQVNPAEVAETLERIFKPSAGYAGSCALPERTSSTLAGTMHHLSEPSNQVHIHLAHDGPAEGTADVPRERILTAVLSAGSSSRLFTEVREKRALCYSVAIGYSPELGFGFSTGYVGTTPDKAQQSLDVMLAELRKVAAGAAPLSPITADEHQRALVGARTRLVFAGESMMARALGLGNDFYRLGRPRSLAEISAALQAVSLADLNEYITRRSLGKVTVVTLGPKGLELSGM